MLALSKCIQVSGWYRYLSICKGNGNFAHTAWRALKPKPPMHPALANTRVSWWSRGRCIQVALVLELKTRRVREFGAERAQLSPTAPVALRVFERAAHQRALKVSGARAVTSCSQCLFSLHMEFVFEPFWQDALSREVDVSRMPELLVHFHPHPHPNIHSALTHTHSPWGTS